MNDAILEISLLPDPLRAKLAAGYRELADDNRRLHAETGYPRFLEMAEYADGRAEAMERGVSLLFCEGGLECFDP
jgi:hypothetical protein